MDVTRDTMLTSHRSGPPRTAGRREWVALAVLCLPLLVASMDVSVLFFAVPAIAQTLRPDAAQLLWIFDIYGFVLAGLLLTTGNLADRIGRRRLLLIGGLLYAGASVLAAYAPSPGWLIAARALLGLGGSTLMPSTLALIRNVFADPTQRAQAVGIWSAVMVGGVGIGPVISGVLLERFFWGSVFLINVPVMALLLVLGPILLPESRSPNARMDLLGSVLSLAAVLPVIHAVKTAGTHGWSASVGAFALAGTLAAVAFVRRQRRAAHPMLDVSLFRVPGFGGSIAIQVIGMFGMMGHGILGTQYLQSVLGLSPLTAALWSLAPSVLVGVAAPGSAVLARRIGRPTVMALGLACAAIGFALMWLARVDSSLVPIMAAGSCIAVGLVSASTLVTEYAIGTAPAERAGSVSALVETAGEFGGAVGMAVLGSVMSAVYAARVPALLDGGPALPDPVRAAVERTLGEATVVATQLGDHGGPVLEAARTAYVDGMHAANALAAVVLLVGAVVALRALPRAIPPTRRAEAGRSA